MQLIVLLIELIVMLLIFFKVWRVEAAITQNNDVKIPASKYFELSMDNGFSITLITVSFYAFLRDTDSVVL